jgi:hypothetical protein
MRLIKHLIIIVSVAPAIAWAPGVAAAARSPSPRSIAALLRTLSHSDSAHVQIVTFADPRLAPVKVVRGGAGRGTAAVSPGPMVPLRASADGTAQIVSFADQNAPPVTVLRGSPAMATGPAPNAASAKSGFGLLSAPGDADLDRVAYAVDGVESSHGADAAMWRPDFDGPQGPMQVSLLAAADSGSGDRFDPVQNRRLGKAYLALLYRRYGNWPDAIAAYNWGPGNMDAWIASSRPALGLPFEVEQYLDRVLRAAAMPPPNFSISLRPSPPAADGEARSRQSPPGRQPDR